MTPRQNFDVAEQDKINGVIAYYADKKPCEVCAMPTRLLWRLFPGGPIRIFCNTRCAGVTVPAKIEVVSLEDLLS